MDTMAPTVPSSPTALYRARREAGEDHDAAVNTVQRSYGRRDLARVLERARLEWEAPPPEAVEPVQKVEPVPDAFTAAEQATRERISELAAERGRLALDALSDPAKRSQLADLSTELAGAEAEIELIGLARLEAARLAAEQTEQADRERIDAARARASDLQAERDRAEAKLAKIAGDFAKTLRTVHDLAAQQAQAMGESGHDNPWQATAPNPAAIQRILATACRSAGAPTDWIGG